MMLPAVAGALLIALIPAPFAAGGQATIAPGLESVLSGPLGLGADQFPRWQENLLEVGDRWVVFARGGDASVPPTVDIDEVPWVVPVEFGLNVVQFLDPDSVPDLGRFEVVDGMLQGSANGGPRVGPNFVVMTAVMAAPIPLDTESAQIDFVLRIPGRDRWEALPQFPDDTWNDGSLVLSLRGSGGEWELVFVTFPNGEITERPFPGFAFIAGETVVVGIEADASLFAVEIFQGAPGGSGTPSRRFGTAVTGTGPIMIAGRPAIDIPGLVMAAPGTRDQFFDYLGSTVPIVPGLPGLFDIPDFDLFVDEDGFIWIKMYPYTPWGPQPPDGNFSNYIQWALRPLGSDESPAYGGFSAHDGESNTFSGRGSETGDPIEGYIMGPDGALLFNTGLVYEGGGLEVFTQSGFLAVEGGPFLYTRRLVQVGEDEIGSSDEPTRFDGEFPTWDLDTGTPVDPPVSTVTTTTTRPASTVTTTSTVGSTVTTQPGTTTPPTVTHPGETCWWCWGIVVVFVAFLVTILCLWVKTYEWWTAWIFWFIIIFVWVPFLLAALWFWGPTWWWWPLLAWFPLIGGYTWWWARRRSWWRPWMLYAVAGYLLALAVGPVVVGSPTWGLLFPLFWLPPVGFYLWYRAPRRPWWQPWLYGVFLGYVGWIFIWVAWLTVWWAWWYPVAMLGALGWWVVSRGGGWRVIQGPKWCWVIPFASIPFLAWWVPLWDFWWCFVIVAFFGLSLLCVVFNHLRQEQWWSSWLAWFLIVFTGVPFLLAGLFFFSPAWWWWPLLAWFPLIGGYAWWWARRQGWWQPWMLYGAFGYLAVLAVAMFVVGAPEWWLLFPFFWLPPMAFYLWGRGLRQPWWHPWMFGAFLLWAGAVVWWVAVATPSPWWARWYPVVFFGILGWWFVTHGYGREVGARKASWIIPCGLLPWMAFMYAIECLPT